MNVSKIAKRGLLYTQTGTPYYASPEVWRDRPYDSKSDIWSAGCVIYEMACLKPPFRAEDMDGLFKSVTSGEYKRLPSHYSVDLNNFVKLMLKVKSNKRPSAADILQIPMVSKRINEEIEVEKGIEPSNDQLLKTILVPKNLKYLSDILPKPNYEPIDFTKSHQNITERSMEISPKVKKEDRFREMSVPILQQLPRNYGLPKKPKIQNSQINNSIFTSNENARKDKYKIYKMAEQMNKYDELIKNQRKRNNLDKNSIKKKIELIIGNGRKLRIESPNKQKIFKSHRENYDSIGQIRELSHLLNKKLKGINSKKETLPRKNGVYRRKQLLPKLG